MNNHKTLTHFFWISLFIIGAFQITSCKKYLDKKNNSSLVVPSTIEDLQALLDYTDKINIATPMYMEVAADDYFVLDATYNSQGVNDRSAYTWAPFDYFHYNDWAAGYYPVYIANLCLETLDKIPLTSQNRDKWNNVKGTAFFLRAFYFLNLSWQHAMAYDDVSSQTDLGIPLRLNSDFNTPSTRASVKETYERIITDAKEASQFLPDNSQHVMRPSKAASYGLLARAYLSMHQYDSALKYSDLSLSVKSSLLNYNTDVTVTATYPLTKFNPETIFYAETFGQFLVVVYNPFALVDSLVYASFDNNDLRKAAYFSPRGLYQFFKGNYTEGGRLFSGLATDEMYLTRAECHARKGDKASALNDLNALLSKRWKTGLFIPLTAVDAADALNKILTERRKELLFRGVRWNDIKRLNKEGANITLKRIIAGQTYLLPPNDNRYALPLPKDIVDQGVKQN